LDHSKTEIENRIFLESVGGGDFGHDTCEKQKTGEPCSCPACAQRQQCARINWEFCAAMAHLKTETEARIQSSGAREKQELVRFEGIFVRTLQVYDNWAEFIQEGSLEGALRESASNVATGSESGMGGEGENQGNGGGKKSKAKKKESAAPKVETVAQKRQRIKTQTRTECVASCLDTYRAALELLNNPYKSFAWLAAPQGETNFSTLLSSSKHSQHVSRDGGAPKSEKEKIVKKTQQLTIQQTLTGAAVTKECFKKVDKICAGSLLQLQKPDNITRLRTELQSNERDAQNSPLPRADGNSRYKLQFELALHSNETSNLDYKNTIQCSGYFAEIPAFGDYYIVMCELSVVGGGQLPDAKMNRSSAPAKKPKYSARYESTRKPCWEIRKKIHQPSPGNVPLTLETFRHAAWDALGEDIVTPLSRLCSSIQTALIQRQKRQPVHTGNSGAVVTFPPTSPSVSSDMHQQLAQILPWNLLDRDIALESDQCFMDAFYASEFLQQRFLYELTGISAQSDDTWNHPAVFTTPILAELRHCSPPTLFNVFKNLKTDPTTLCYEWNFPPELRARHAAALAEEEQERELLALSKKYVVQMIPSEEERVVAMFYRNTLHAASTLFGHSYFFTKQHLSTLTPSQRDHLMDKGVLIRSQEKEMEEPPLYLRSEWDLQSSLCAAFGINHHQQQQVQGYKKNLPKPQQFCIRDYTTPRSCWETMIGYHLQPRESIVVTSRDPSLPVAWEEYHGTVASVSLPTLLRQMYQCQKSARLTCALLERTTPHQNTTSTPSISSANATNGATMDTENDAVTSECDSTADPSFCSTGDVSEQNCVVTELKSAQYTHLLHLCYKKQLSLRQIAELSVWCKIRQCKNFILVDVHRSHPLDCAAILPLFSHFTQLQKFLVLLQSDIPKKCVLGAENSITKTRTNEGHSLERRVPNHRDFFGLAYYVRQRSWHTGNGSGVGSNGIVGAKYLHDHTTNHDSTKENNTTNNMETARVEEEEEHDASTAEQQRTIQVSLVDLFRELPFLYHHHQKQHKKKIVSSDSDELDGVVENLIFSSIGSTTTTSSQLHWDEDWPMSPPSLQPIWIRLLANESPLLLVQKTANALFTPRSWSEQTEPKTISAVESQKFLLPSPTNIRIVCSSPLVRSLLDGELLRRRAQQWKEEAAKSAATHFLVDKEEAARKEAVAAKILADLPGKKAALKQVFYVGDRIVFTRSHRGCRRVRGTPHGSDPVEAGFQDEIEFFVDYDRSTNKHHFALNSTADARCAGVAQTARFVALRQSRRIVSLDEYPLWALERCTITALSSARSQLYLSSTAFDAANSGISGDGMELLVVVLDGKNLSSSSFSTTKTTTTSSSSSSSSSVTQNSHADEMESVEEIQRMAWVRWKNLMRILASTRSRVAFVGSPNTLQQWIDEMFMIDDSTSNNSSLVASRAGAEKLNQSCRCETVSKLRCFSHY
jgi:hypothetical protein